MDLGNFMPVMLHVREKPDGNWRPAERRDFDALSAEVGSDYLLTGALAMGLPLAGATADYCFGILPGPNIKVSGTSSLPSIDLAALRAEVEAAKVS